ncbi:MAG: hypothetical protein M0R06_18040 [Sphaerochaeta sp.]|nr:hypothetical protein [Sphaerochaeta sp.]
MSRQGEQNERNQKTQSTGKPHPSGWRVQGKECSKMITTYLVVALITAIIIVRA